MFLRNPKNKNHVTEVDTRKSIDFLKARGWTEVDAPEGAGIRTEGQRRRLAQAPDVPVESPTIAVDAPEVEDGTAEGAEGEIAPDSQVDEVEDHPIVAEVKRRKRK